jgi:hypothetical protein
MVVAFISLLVAVFIFLIGALAPVFDWSLGKFSPLYWGLFFFSLSFLVSGASAYVGRFRQ